MSGVFQPEGDGASPQPLPSSGLRFQHRSEKQFAELLDFYRVRWEYEPRTFVFSRDGDGNPTEAFAPDFYLPDQDLYIEITTMDQRLVRRKNKKLRRLAEHFPDVNCKLFYQRDFEALLTKYGLT
ncbi:MAG: hypothetical protein DYH08_00100 [Actinobacteria bacterium ATB1]|nr:hypothetical protein [Actinobacteria bacterium ATB1]